MLLNLLGVRESEVANGTSQFVMLFLILKSYGLLMELLDGSSVLKNLDVTRMLLVM